MKLLIGLVAVSTVIVLVIALVVFPMLEADVNRARSNAAYAEQQKLLAHAEVERARAATVTAKGEADALRMAINQPIALLAIPISLLAVVSVTVLVLTLVRQQPRASYGQQQYEQPRTVTVLVNGKLETLYVSPGQDPVTVAQHYLNAASSRNLTVWLDQ
jgi:hypothetical protein